MRLFGIISLAGALVASAACSSSSSTTPAATAATTTASATAPATSGGEQASSEAFHRMTVDELSAAIQNHENVTIFDNNRQERYAQGHIPGARWVSYDAVNASVLPSDHSARLVFYCANESCHACHNAANAAVQAGYTNVSILPAGIMGWTAAGKPTVAGANPN